MPDINKIKLNRYGKLPKSINNIRADIHGYEIMRLFSDRLRNHTLQEVCEYIAGYFYRQQITSFGRIKRLEGLLQESHDLLTQYTHIVEGHDELPNEEAVLSLMDQIEAALKVK